MIRLISGPVAQSLEQGNGTIRSWSQVIEQSSVSWMKQTQQTCRRVWITKIRNGFQVKSRGIGQQSSEKYRKHYGLDRDSCECDPQTSSFGITWKLRNAKLLNHTWPTESKTLVVGTATYVLKSPPDYGDAQESLRTTVQEAQGADRRKGPK